MLPDQINLSIGLAIYLVSLTVILLPPGADKPVAIVLLLAQIFTFFASEGRRIL